MILGNFYFLQDSYFEDFLDSYLMKNIEIIDGKIHDRPCFYAFSETNTNIYWMIPFSSQIIKYEDEYNKKLNKNGKCDTIIFGDVLGYKKAFLIQNMCPIIPKYIKNEYLDSRGNPVKINRDFEIKLIQSAKKILILARQNKTNYRYIFPDIFKIEKSLVEQINKELYESD